MKLFKHSQGFIIAFGFDMVQRREAPRMISWSDPTTGEWDTKSSNLAGSMTMSFTVAPEFVFEQSGRVIAYQPGKCVEMAQVGFPYVWRVTTLQSDMQISEVA
jgi:hypothetical protein